MRSLSTDSLWICNVESSMDDNVATSQRRARVHSGPCLSDGLPAQEERGPGEAQVRREDGPVAVVLWGHKAAAQRTTCAAALFHSVRARASCAQAGGERAREALQEVRSLRGAGPTTAAARQR